MPIARTVPVSTVIRRRNFTVTSSEVYATRWRVSACGTARPTRPGGPRCSASGGAARDVSPYAAPARAEDLSGLPPAFLDVGSAETFRDEVVTYATRLWQAGGVAELHVWPGGFHGFDGLVPQATLSQACQTAPMEWLRRLLAE